jgi:hypothetical protein
LTLPLPNITYFDPAISKVGILQEGSLGLPGEKLTWVMTITNIGTGPGYDIVIIDEIQPELRQITTCWTLDHGEANCLPMTSMLLWLEQIGWQVDSLLLQRLQERGLVACGAEVAGDTPSRIDTSLAELEQVLGHDHITLQTEHFSDL